MLLHGETHDSDALFKPSEAKEKAHRQECLCHVTPSAPRNHSHFSITVQGVDSIPSAGPNCRTESSAVSAAEQIYSWTRKDPRSVSHWFACLVVAYPL